MTRTHQSPSGFSSHWLSTTTSTSITSTQTALAYETKQGQKEINNQRTNENNEPGSCCKTRKQRTIRYSPA
jgi:hypothetical protein